MAQFRKKPIVIEAVQWFRNGDHPAVGPGFMVGGLIIDPTDHLANVHGARRTNVIKTLEGWYEVSIGDWIIRGVKGELYPCKPDVFAQTYEPV